MSIGSKIKELREQKGYSQTEFANNVHISKQTLYKYENDIVTNIPSDKIEEIAQALYVTPAYLMGWDDEDSPVHELLKAYENQLSIGGDTQKAIDLYKLYLQAPPEARKAVEVLLKFEPPQS